MVRRALRTYAPPSVVSFRKGAYLEFSVNSKLPATVAGSRYKLAALAFDNHIAHLVRPIAFQFQGDTHPSTALPSAPRSILAPLRLQQRRAAKVQSAMGPKRWSSSCRWNHCDATKAMTARASKLIDAGAILINGERVSLDLQNGRG